MFRSAKLLSKHTQKTLPTEFFSEEKIFKVKQHYNSQSDLVYVPQKMRIVGMSVQRLFCEI